MPKKKKTSEEHLEIIELLLAGILLKRDVDVKKVAKIIGCSDKKLTEIYPEKSSKKNKREGRSKGG